MGVPTWIYHKDYEPMIVDSDELKKFYKKLGEDPGSMILRKIKIKGKEKEVCLPIIAAWPKSKEQYIEEFRRANFNILKAYKEDTKPVGCCWIIIAKKG